MIKQERDVRRPLFNKFHTEKSQSGYTREKEEKKNRNLNDHCNDDCNASLEFRMRILERMNEFVYKHLSAEVQRSHKLHLPKEVLDVFAYTRKIRTVIFKSETSLEFTSGLEFEFVILICVHTC